MADVPTPKDLAARAKPLPAFDLVEHVGVEGWTVCCDFCPAVRDFIRHSHSAARGAAAASGWRYTRDHFNACPGCVQAGI